MLDRGETVAYDDEVGRQRGDKAKGTWRRDGNYGKIIFLGYWHENWTMEEDERAASASLIMPSVWSKRARECPHRGPPSAHALVESSVLKCT